MANDVTLLAHLVPRLTNRVEDTATDALAFILTKSATCRQELDRLLEEGDFKLDPISSVETQVTYEDGSRPDMAGYDRGGSKRLLVEAKFWATLLEGQASGYIGQLEQTGPGVLLFIAPDSRIETLWAEIERQMGEAGVQLEPIGTPAGTKRARVTGSEKHVMLVSWRGLLRSMAVAVAVDSSIASDIHQLLGLAEHQDETAFQPIRSDELAPSFPRRIRGLNRLIDDAVSKLCGPTSRLTTAGFRATPQIEGYGRYFGVEGVEGVVGDFFFGVNYERWATRAETPLWLRIGSQLRAAVPTPVERYVPVHLKTGVEYEDVLNDVIRQVKAITDLIEEP